MTRSALIAGVLVAACASPTAFAAQGSAPARATIVDPLSLRLSWSLAMPSVGGSASGAYFLGLLPSVGVDTATPANIAIVVRRVDDTGAPVTAPVRFEVAGGGAGKVLIVRTGATDGVRLATNGAIMGGALQGGSAASIGIGRSPAGADAPQTPATLAIVVQYN